MKGLTFYKNRVAIILLLPLLLSFAGCVYLVVGGIGAVGGYIVSPDTVEGVTSNDAESVWDAAVQVVSIMGLIKEQRKEAGTIIGKVSGAKVQISLISLNDSTTKLRVEARKFKFPRISTAQDIFVKIMGNLNE